MKNDLLETVRLEIEQLHRFFVGWFSGTLPASAFESEFLPRFSEDMVFIPPAGRLLGLDNLATAVRERYSSNPDFRIAIRQVQIHRQFDNHVVASYEEWQRNALASTPADNGRLATVLFHCSEPLKWLHIHETWLPPDVMSAGPYNF